jgi:glutathione synthase/RimK-type ligase-like ATP-grasp enzyme
VNPWECCVRAENKLWQHYWAERAGLATPESLYTNDPVKIRCFIDEHGGKIIYKPFAGTIWVNGQKEWGYYTNIVTLDDLVDDDLLQTTPGIYQELVAKDHELRVTVMGHEFFVARVNSQETMRGRLDWRRAYDDLTMEQTVIPAALETKCRDLMGKLGLVFGCFDFVVTPNGKYVFLEVNQAGQFLFIEEATGMPLLDAFAEFLLAGRADFRWSADHEIVPLSKIMEEAAATSKNSLEHHVISRPTQANEATGRRSASPGGAVPE